MRGHPDVDLTESRLEAFLELTEELAVFRQIVHVNNDAHRVILENLTFMVPSPVNDLRFPSHRTELILEFEQCVSNGRVGHGLTVIEPQRQECLVAAPGAYRWQAPRR